MYHGAYQVHDVAVAAGIDDISLTDMINSATQVAQATANNFSSMHQDALNGNETEIDYINGYVVRLGEKHGVQTPINSALVALVKLKAQTIGYADTKRA